MEAAQVCSVCGKPAGADAPHGLCPECLMKSGFETRGNDPAEGKPGFVPPSVEEIAKLFPQLEIIELLGRGGMGAVYKARQPRLNRFVALKILSPEKQNDPQFAERFEREARALAWLNHPNIVTVYDFGTVGQASSLSPSDKPAETGGTRVLHFLLMEFVDGLTLRQLMQTQKLSPAEALGIVPKICEALQYAHEQGVIHRDIKPENILLDKQGRVKITDFGIAKILDLGPGDLSLTGARDVVGTPNYMAPEQIEKPQSVDARADIYSLGVVFYEMLTGELPLGKFQPPSQKAQIDARLDEVVLHALEKEPDRRYQHASEVKTDVETIAATPTTVAARTVPTSAPPVPPLVSGTARSSTGMSDGWKIAIIFGVLALLGLFLLACLEVLFFGKKQTPPMPPREGLAASTGSVNTNAFENLLNEDQRAVAQRTDGRFHKYFDARTFDGWQDNERANLESHLMDTLRGPQTSESQKNEYFQAINSLAALHSTRALPELRKIAFYRPDKLLRAEISNRGRWMAVRALGIMGDKQSAPELIHLLYHNNSNTRWWAQISLVRLTGRNFGKDWKAWGNWWNSQNGQPPFSPEVIRWWSGQAEPDGLAESFTEADQRFLDSISGKSAPKIDDAFWLKLDRRNYQQYRAELQKAPHVLVVRPTHYDLNQSAGTGIGIHYGWVDGKLANLCVGFSELVSYAYTKKAVWDEQLMTRTEFPPERQPGQLTNRFDIIDTLRVQPVERLQAEIKQLLKEQFGLAGHRETRDTEVFLIKVKAPEILESKISHVFADSRSIPELAGDWENFFGKPVLDETGLTNRYDRKLGLIPAAYVPNRTKDLDANNEFLARYGLELVPARRPMEWLVMETARKDKPSDSDNKISPEMEDTLPDQ